MTGFFRWQVGSKMLGGRLIVDWVDDAKFIVQKGETGLTGNLYCGLMEYEDMAFLLHYLRETDEFYDVGANVGAYTILASGVRGCKSYTFEPLPDTYDRLLDQIKINRIDELVVPNNKGVGAEPSVLEFTSNLNCANHVNTDPNNKDVVSVEVTTLDSIDPDHSSIVKVDVEGYESFVLEGGKAFFGNPQVAALIVELNGSGEKFGISDDDIDRKIRSFGFVAVKYDPKSRSLNEAGKYNTGGNTVYVKNVEQAAQRCASAEEVTIHTAGDVRI
ncbi:FkbM family methyltransferase [Martelella radicis]|uniref:FkbM family methyltransferase n=1 Tax=Martelella radicis TaxID=1397476 RepID=A0A7W6PB77_9HYPH|nr:FkbM family methyltransferase [Martelella radicis]MBB4122142.1 FkbM family methyltransferase [Martelella radicis]